ncbi:MAG: hypothetical protein PHV34_12005 [Verrucomicrobiae bacterium]|nr:hypothetical protein [Verrucomicrobiae bacterium]
MENKLSPDRAGQLNAQCPTLDAKKDQRPRNGHCEKSRRQWTTKQSPALDCFIIALATLVAGCAGSRPTVAVTPSVLSHSFDYSRPPDIAGQSKPVWILPTIVQGWVPARADPKTGEWIGGHYTATVTEDGHWATLEEAQLGGKPHVLAGDGKAVVPLPPAKTPASGSGNGEIDLLGMEQRLNALESGQARNTTNPDEKGVSESKTQHVILPARRNGQPGEYEMSIPPGEKLRIHYLDDRNVEITCRGRCYRRQLRNPGDTLEIRIPTRL